MSFGVENPIFIISIKTNSDESIDIHCFNTVIVADVRRDRIYWMECNTGDLKSASYNGSDIKTVFNTNSNINWDIATSDDFIFCASKNQILKINKSPGQNAKVVHTDAYRIHGIVFVEQKGKNVRKRVMK